MNCGLCMFDAVMCLCIGTYMYTCMCVKRGRIYQALSKYPDKSEIEKLCYCLVGLGQQKSERLPQMNATHLLLLYYATAQGMGWHRDSDPNDGDNDHPV